MLDLIGFIEETYGVEIKDEELVPENFDNVSYVARFVENKLGKTGDGNDGASAESA
jgi:acyl carrier protein